MVKNGKKSQQMDKSNKMDKNGQMKNSLKPATYKGF